MTNTTHGPIHIGVGGWNFEPWRGVFYPEKHPKTRELEYAGQHLTAIEINATYYGSQKPESFAKWAATVPDGFKFSVKASRFATNRKKLSEGKESIERFLNQGITRLEDRLGPILWQFMKTKKFATAEERADFAGFLALLPEKQDGQRLQHALEVRHDSFIDPEFVALARDRNMAIVFADSGEFPCIDEVTADFTYARLQRSQEDIVTGYTDPQLDHWAERSRNWGGDNREAYVFFIAGAKVHNPAAAQALIAKIDT